MNCKRLILMTLFLAATTACTSMQTTSTSAPAELSAHKTDADLNSKKYGTQVGIYSINDIGSVTCPTDKKIDSEKNWKKLMSFADGCISKNQWSSVEIIGQKLSQVEPDAPWGPYYLSVASEKRGNMERAMWMVDLALKKADSIGILRYQKGRILWQQQFFKEAIAEIEKAVSQDNGIKDAHLFLGQVYLRELDFKKAEDHFQAVLAVDSKNFPALLGYANCEIELEKTSEALATLDKAISQYPHIMDLRLQEIYVYENLLNQPEVALRKYKTLQSLMATRKIEGHLPFDMTEKIKNLEAETLKLRQVASEKATPKK